VKPKIDYFDLMSAVESRYIISMLYGWPPMFDVNAEDDEDDTNPLASVESREGAFNTWVTKIYVYAQTINEFFQRIIGLDYNKVRIYRPNQTKQEDDLDDY